MNKYWFKRKRYGWGWTPSTWQGWLVTLVFIVLSVGLGLMLDGEGESGLFFVYFLPLLATFFIITYKTAPKPKWRWGKQDSDNALEDF